VDLVGGLYQDATHAQRNGKGDSASANGLARRVSVIIPARNEAHSIAATIEAVFAQALEGTEVEVIVADDASTDATAAEAVRAGAHVVRCPGRGGNPGAARNIGVRNATGDPIVFLDADCVPAAGWLDAILSAHDTGAAIVGGSLAPARGLSLTSLFDYFSSAYLVHPGRAAGPVPNHPPANLSVRREPFLRTGGFTQDAPVCDGHEELGWQAELRRAGAPIYFEPNAVALHRNRAGLSNLIRRNFRWAYSAIQSKSESGNVRLAWLYRHPYLLIAFSLPIAIMQTLFILGCWLRARRYEVIPMLPVIFVARLAYAWGMSLGGLRWLRNGSAPPVGSSLMFR
jgi:glycosyltransferase involved in cell wall biosynthesis